MAQPYTRRLRNLLIDPNFQVKYAFYFATCGVAVMAVLFILIVNRLNQLIGSLGAVPGAPLPASPHSATIIYDVAFYAVIAFFVNLIFSFWFALWVTHRVAGPARVIEAYIADIKAGNFENQRTLRKSDHLQSVMASLRDLAASLKAQSTGLRK